MQITSLGHAGARVAADGVRLVMDPWLSRQGAFQGAWFQFPSNAHLDPRTVLDCDWVSVSHEHLDHMDLWALAQLPERTRILIPAYPAPKFRDRLRRSGLRNLIEVPAWSRFPLNNRGDWLTFIPEQCPMSHDSGVLVSAGGRSFLHCNDARLSIAQARRAAHEVGGQLDVLAVQMSGASWHPICYEYPADVRRSISAAKRIGKFKAVSRFVRSVRPRLAVPFAGPPCFLDPALAQFNSEMAPPGIFPDLEQATAWLATAMPQQRVLYWLPGDTLDAGSVEHVRDPHWNGFSFAEVGGYLERYQAERRPELAAVHAAHPEPADDLAGRFEEHFRRLGDLNAYFLRRIGITLRFDVLGTGGGRWDVQLGPDRAHVDLTGSAREVQYRLRVESRWLAPVLTGQIGWEDLLLSLRISAWRDPDIYNDYLIGMLKHADARALGAVEDYELNRRSDETVVIAAPEGSYEVSRYCPHAGEDLSYGAVVVDGKLRCLGHNFEFSLQTGECLNARCDPISARPVGELHLTH